MQKLLHKNWTTILFLGLLQGLFCSISLAPFNAPILGWLLPWPLFYLAARYRNNMMNMIFSGLSCSFFFTLFTFYWMYNLFENFIGLNAVMSVLTFIPFALFFNLQIPVFIILFGLSLRKKWRKYIYPRWLSAGIIALMVDFSIPRIFSYSWANSIAGNPFIVQITEVVGLYGLTFLLFSVSYFFYRIFHMMLKNGGSLPVIIRRSKKTLMLFRLKYAVIVPGILLFCFIYGTVRKYQVESLQKTLPSVRVAIINPNAPPEDKRFTTKKIMNELMNVIIPDLVEKASKISEGKLDLVVLPESAVPYVGAYNSPLNKKMKAYSENYERMVQLLAYNWNVDVFLNETLYDEITNIHGKKKIKSYNSSVLYSRDGKRRDSYQKRKLLAFGEYLPGDKLFQKIGIKDSIVNLIGESRFEAGPSSNLIPYDVQNMNQPYKNKNPLSYTTLKKKKSWDIEKEFPDQRSFRKDGYFLPLICYEVLFPDHVRTFFNNPKKHNPDFIVNITQDGWYGETIETYQHYDLGRIRSVETRRALVRAVNDGAAGFVDIAGNYVKPLVGPIMTRSDEINFQVWDVPINRESKTIYVLYGDMWIGIFFLLFFILVITRFTVKFNQSKISPNKEKMLI